MATKRIIDFIAGSIADSDLTYIGDPVSGYLSGVTYGAIKAYISGATSGNTVTNTDGSLTIAAGVASLNTGHSNTFVSAQTFTLGALSATVASAVMIRNTTPATASVQQNSPALHLEGQGWKTSSTASSQPVLFREYVQP